MKKTIITILTIAIFFNSAGFTQMAYAQKTENRQTTDLTANVDGPQKQETDQNGEQTTEKDNGDIPGDNKDNDKINDDSSKDNQLKEDNEDHILDENQKDSEENNSEINGEDILEDADQNISDQTGEDAPQQMKINLLEKPYGVTREAMSFSWADSSGNGMQIQSAYRLVLSKRLKNISSGIYLYDTGWVESNQNTSVLYDMSSVLEENELYYWQVQVRNNEGTESSLSEPQAFTTAVGEKWESQKGIWGTEGQSIVMLRSELEKDENVEKAVITVTASSAEKTRQYVYNLYINGQEAGIGPVRQDGEKMYYNTYDITDFLAEGKNVIGVINYSEENPAFLCQITYYMKDGSQNVVMNSGKDQSQWKALDADDIYFGNDTASIGTWSYSAKRDSLNANKFPFGWENLNYDTTLWKNVTQNSNFNKYILTSSQMDNMKRYEVSPEIVTKSSEGQYFIDFGKEIIGGIKLDLTCSARDIKIEYGEELNEDGTVRSELAAENVYRETWSLKKGYQSLFGIGMKTFRYVAISNLPEEFTKENIKGLMIRQEFSDEASDFQSSNTVLNDVYKMCKYTSKAATQDVYVDSQNRERIPYEGDALITALNSYNYSASSTSAKFTAEYLLNHTTWPAEYSLHNITMIYQNYMYTGDRRNLEESYELLKGKTLENYFDESIGLMKNVEDGLVENQSVMTDWPVAERDGYKVDEVEYNTVFNAVCAGGYTDMAKIANILGNESDRLHYQTLADTIKNNMIQKLYDRQTGRFWDGLSMTGEIVRHSAQHATAYALAYGIFDSEDMSQSMYDAIEADGELKMSLYGAFFMLQGLYNTDHGDLARKIMSNPDSELGVKSWAYMMYGQKATITTEFWENIGKTNMSMAHAWGTSPGVMLVRGMFGIQPTSAGFDTFQIKLQPGGLEQASIKIPTLKGEISASYLQDGSGGISGSFNVPSNSQVTFYVPVTGMRSQLSIDGVQVNASREGEFLACQVGPGEHTYQADTGIIPDSSEWVEEDVVYGAYRDGRWTEDNSNRINMRNPKNAKIEAVRLKIKNQSVPGEIQYSAYMQGSGWQEFVNEWQEAGSTKDRKRLEAFRVQLTGELAEKYDVYYRAYIEGKGWLDWAVNGEPAGSSGYSKEVYRIQATLVKKGGAALGNTSYSYLSSQKKINYQTHVQTYGWQVSCGDGETSGTVGSGKRLEGIKISLDNSLDGTVKYQTHVQTYGWQDWKENGQMSGTSGESKRLEAIKIQLEGSVEEKYDIYYRVHVQTYGWLDWTKNGEPAGTEGLAKRLEAIEIKLIKKGEDAPGRTLCPYVGNDWKVRYQTHVQGYGWQEFRYDGLMSGTSGEARRLEAIQMQLGSVSVEGGIRYRTHVQSYGWQNWALDGQMSGTSGESKRLEAIQIELTGKAADKYDIYYRVHAQTYGWLGWAKNGKSAGTEGLSTRLEAIEIVMVEKGGEAPGKQTGVFIKKK